MIGTIFLLFFSISSFSYTSASLTLCRPDQRDALLDFKSEFELRNPPEFYDEESQDTWTLFSVTCYPKTKSWENSTDCCYWKGITCDANSGVVIGLDLSCSCLHGHFKPSSRLFSLRHLQNLNLAYNDFSGSSIPTEINKLMGLQRLNLSHSSFFGTIPAEILHLTKLVFLDLSSTFMDSQVLLSTKKSFLSQLAHNLTNLRQLDMSYVNLSSEIPQMMISNLTSLRSIRLHHCHLFGRLPRLSPTIQSIDLSINPYLEYSLPAFNGNNSLVYLDFSETSLSGSLPDSISNLKHLKALKLYGCKFTGKIPSSIGNLSHLSFLNLGLNNFGDGIPSSFQNLNRMTHLELQDNKLSGEIPTALFNLPKLSVLTLSSNQFTGTLPPNITSLSNLNFFDAESNSFFGTIPSTFFNIPSLVSLRLGNNQLNGPLEIGNVSSLSKLRMLDLSKNNLTGPIPRSISKLVNLVYLDLSYFNIQGPLDVGIFLRLTLLEDLTLSHLNATTAIDLNAVLSSPHKSLSSLDLSGNHVSLENMSSVSTISSQLQRLFMSSCGITVFPEFIRSLRQIYAIDLSNNNIKGQVPAWLWRLPELYVVSLSNNTISGFREFPKDLSRTKIYLIYLSKNNFSREIPISICEMSSLGIVDLSNNNFNGSVPQCLIKKMSLTVLNLGNNHLSGKLADIFPKDCNLRSLNVGHNQLVGKLPRSLSDCSSLEVLNMEHNRINDTFPFWLGSLPELKVVILRSNEFHGSLQYHHHPKVASVFPLLRVIDISDNDFTGTLPSDFFMYWSAMHSEGDRSELKYIGGKSYYHDSMVLMNKGIELTYTRIFKLLTAIDISGNMLHGNIPESIGLLKALKMLNLSSNGFVGNMPSSLANLVQMESLDLSHNKLSGHIPHGLAQLTSLSTIRISHNKLVGMIPKSTQFQTQNASGFEDNFGLCGAPLGECGVGNDDQPLTQQEEEEKEEEVLSWTAAAIGFAPGIVLGLIIGHLMILYKPHWFFKVLHINA